MALNFYDAYINNLAKTPKERYLDDNQEFIDLQFQNSSSWENILEEQVFGTSEYTDLIVRINDVFNPTTGEKLGFDFTRLIFENTTFNNVLGKRYNFGDNIWIAINMEFEKKETSSCIARRCNNVAKWYDSEGALREEPVILDYKLNYTGFDFDDAITIDSGKKYMIMQNNDISSQLKVNDRFIFNGKAFKIEQIDRFLNTETFNSSSVPSLYITVKKDQESESDDLVNNIPNAFDINYTIQIDQGDISQSIGYTTQLTATVKLNDEVVVRDVEWASSDDSVCTVDANGNIEMIADGSCSIFANLLGNTSVIDDINILVDSVPVSNEEIRFEPNVTEITKDVTQNYQCFKYDNNVIQADTFTYTLSGASSVYYEFTNIDGNNFSVKSLGFTYDKLTVRATSDVDASFEEIEIQLKNKF